MKKRYLTYLVILIFLIFKDVLRNQVAIGYNTSEVLLSLIFLSIIFLIELLISFIKKRKYIIIYLILFLIFTSLSVINIVLVYNEKRIMNNVMKCRNAWNCKYDNKIGKNICNYCDFDDCDNTIETIYCK